MVDWGVRDSLRGLQGWLLPPLLSLLLIPGHNSSLRQVLHCSAGSLQHQLCLYYYISSHRWTRNTGRCRAFSLRLVDSFQKRNNWYRNRNSRYGKFQNRNTWYENQNRNTKRKLQHLFFLMIFWHQIITNTQERKTIFSMHSAWVCRNNWFSSPLNVDNWKLKILSALTDFNRWQHSSASLLPRPLLVRYHRHHHHHICHYLRFSITFVIINKIKI